MLQLNISLIFFSCVETQNQFEFFYELCCNSKSVWILFGVFWNSKSFFLFLELWWNSKPDWIYFYFLSCVETQNQIHHDMGQTTHGIHGTSGCFFLRTPKEPWMLGQMRSTWWSATRTTCRVPSRAGLASWFMASRRWSSSMAGDVWRWSWKRATCAGGLRNVFIHILNVTDFSCVFLKKIIPVKDFHPNKIIHGWLLGGCPILYRICHPNKMGMTQHNIGHVWDYAIFFFLQESMISNNLQNMIISMTMTMTMMMMMMMMMMRMRMRMTMTMTMTMMMMMMMMMMMLLISGDP